MLWIHDSDKLHDNDAIPRCIEAPFPRALLMYPFCKSPFQLFHCEKGRRKGSLPAFSPIPTMLSIAFFPHVLENAGLCGKGGRTVKVLSFLAAIIYPPCTFQALNI